MVNRPKSLRLKKNKNRAPKKLNEALPGRAILPEDNATVWGKGTLRKQPPRRPAPKVVSNERVSRTQVEDRLMTAMQTIRSIPDRERSFFIVKSSSPDYIRDYMEGYSPENEIVEKFRPTPEQVSDCLVALAWVRHLDKFLWKILWWRSFGVSFGVIAKYIGRSDETARKRYQEAIIDAWAAANGA